MDFFKTKKRKLSESISCAISVCEKKIEDAKADKESVSVNIAVTDFGIKNKLWLAFKDEIVLKVRDHFTENGLSVYYRERSPSRFTVSWDKKHPWQRKNKYVLLTQLRKKEREGMKK